MKILELCLSPDFGGLEIHMRDFTAWLSRRADCAPCAAVQENTRLHRALATLNAPLLTFPAGAGKFPLAKARLLAKFIETQTVDIVHVHWKYDLPLTALAKRFSKRPFRLLHTRQMSLPGKKFDPYHRFVYGAMDGFIAITQYIARQARENLPLPAERIHQIYYGVAAPPPVDPEATAGLKRELGIGEEFVVGLLGRISEFKGQRLLLEALHRLNRERIRLHALIVGEAFEPEYLNGLQQFVQVNGLGEQVRFRDFHPRPYELMACLDALALTTKRETFGLVLIEAMQVGIPVIGSNAGGVPEIIDHEQTGLLFESWNAASLAQALKRLYLDPDLRKRIAAAGQRKARENFDLEKQYQKVLQTFRELHGGGIRYRV